MPLSSGASANSRAALAARGRLAASRHAAPGRTRYSAGPGRAATWAPGAARCRPLQAGPATDSRHLAGGA